MTADVSALILGGGKASRMGGVDKRFINVEGTPIFYRQLAVLEPRVSEVILSGPYDERPQPRRTMLPMVAFDHLVPPKASYGPFRIAHDRVEGVGPLAGIAAGLEACTTEWLLVVAGDMPFLTGELIDRMLAERGAGAGLPGRADEGRDLDAVGIMSNGLPEPLVCMLHRRVLPIVERRIADRIYKASGLLLTEGLNVRWITDADPRALRNVNSPDDL